MGKHFSDDDDGDRGVTASSSSPFDLFQSKHSSTMEKESLLTVRTAEGD